MNVYLYVHNNPINDIDPLGLSESKREGFESPDAAAVAALTEARILSMEEGGWRTWRRVEWAGQLYKKDGKWGYTKPFRFHEDWCNPRDPRVQKLIPGDAKTDGSYYHTHPIAKSPDPNKDPLKSQFSHPDDKDYVKDGGTAYLGTPEGGVQSYNAEREKKDWMWKEDTTQLEAGVRNVAPPGTLPDKLPESDQKPPGGAQPKPRDSEWKDVNRDGIEDSTQPWKFKGEDTR